MSLNWYKKAQEIFRGDPNPIDLDQFDVEYGNKVLGKDLGSVASLGPGIYFADTEEGASMYGSNITKRVLQNANILTEQSPLFSYQQIEKILRGIDKEKMETAILNWNENYNIGKKELIKYILNSNNPIDQLMNIWADIFYHQNPNTFMELMAKNGIDGIVIPRHDASIYVIYNRNLLK